MNATIFNQTARTVVLCFVFALAACGGGGGSSGGSTASTPQPVEVVKDDMTVAPPVAPARTDAPAVVNTAAPMPGPTTAPGISVPNSLIPSAGLGTRDSYFMAGGGYDGDIRDDERGFYNEGITAFGKRIEGPFNRDPRLEVPNPPRDVRTAWRDGWTGQGVNILIADGFSAPGRRGETHGYTVGMSALEIAPGANYYGYDIGLNPFDTYRRGVVRRPEDNAIVSANTRFDVINLSIGSAPIEPPYTAQRILDRVNEIDTNVPVYGDVLGGRFLTNADDAVITKAAGNESTDAALPVENLALVLLDETKDRVLIVGALNRYAQAGSARLSSYSNHAGVSTDLQERFLVEYGGSPYGEEAYLCDAAIAASVGCRNLQLLGDVSDEGTSYSAPRVAGHAALVRHKFPRLSGAQTAKILLDTATTQGLVCHPSCNVETYGQGRVSIADALSPIGKLQ